MIHINSVPQVPICNMEWMKGNVHSLETIERVEKMRAGTVLL